MHDGTLYGTVCGSDWGWKDTPGLGLIQKRVPQLFRLCYHPLSHAKTQ